MAVTGKRSVWRKVAYDYLHGASTATNPLPPVRNTFVKDDREAISRDIYAVGSDLRISMRRAKRELKSK